MIMLPPHAPGPNLRQPVTACVNRFIEPAPARSSMSHRAGTAGSHPVIGARRLFARDSGLYPSGVPGRERDTESFMDLDAVPALSGVRPPWWKARVPVLVVALLLVVTGVLASAVTHRWQAWRDGRVLRVEAMVPAAAPGSAFSVSYADTPDQAAYLPTSLLIVNSGPLPVEVISVVADQNGLSVSPAEGAKLIRPGVDSIGVIVALECPASVVPDAPLPLTMRVRMPDGRTVELVSQLTVRGTPWAAHLDGSCATEPA